MKKVLGNCLFIIYAVIAIFVTICLLSFNGYKVTEFDNYSLVIIDSSELEPDYNDGDLVIVDSSERIRVGNKVFFYNTYEEDIGISVAEITGIEKVTETEYTYTLTGDYKLSSEYVIGNVEDTTVIPNLGKVLGFLESKWGFLLLIVFPSLMAFIYQITVVFADIREVREEEKKEKNKTNKKAKEDKK